MKKFIFVLVPVLIIILSWLSFFIYSEKETLSMSREIELNVLGTIEERDWEEAVLLISNLREHWLSYQRIATLFIDNDCLLEVDECLVRALRYTEAEDDSNSPGELQAAAEKISNVTKTHKLSMENIF